MLLASCNQSPLQAAAEYISSSPPVLELVYVTSGLPEADGAVPDRETSSNGNLLTGFENLEEVLSPETAAASKQAAAAAANGNSDDVAAPAAGVSLLGGLVTAKSKASQGLYFLVTFTS